MIPNSVKIENCFDSHVHWLATGAFSERMLLFHLKSASELCKIPVPQHGDWVLGFGWDFPIEGDAVGLLDQWCSDRPVALSKKDGHALWVNSKALERAGLPKSSGILLETERAQIFKAAKVTNEAELCRQLLKAQKIFHSFGVTHIRDVNMSPEQFHAALHLENSGLLKLAAEIFFYEEHLDPQALIPMALKAKESKSSQLRVKGVKVFLDGSLGSETALLSQPYLSGSGCGWSKYTQDQLENIIKDIWAAGLEVAVHVIGDEAAHKTALAATRCQNSGISGKIHFEHFEIARGETLELLKHLDATAHIQPSHWLGDKAWLSKKVDSSLLKNIFPWRKLQEQETPFFFGSDSPVTTPNPWISKQAVMDSLENGVPKLLGDVESYHSHPDRSWVPNTYSVFVDEKLDHIVFNGEHI